MLKKKYHVNVSEIFTFGGVIVEKNSAPSPVRMDEEHAVLFLTTSSALAGLH